MKAANIKYLYESLFRYIDMLKKSVSDWTVCGLWLSRFLTSVKSWIQFLLLKEKLNKCLKIVVVVCGIPRSWLCCCCFLFTVLLFVLIALIFDSKDWTQVFVNIKKMIYPSAIFLSPTVYF